MAAKITGEDLAVPIETVEQWTTIAGEHAVKDMLFGALPTDDCTAPGLRSDKCVARPNA